MINRPGLSNMLVDLAEEVHRAEERIKQEILDAAERGDNQRVVELMRRWMTLPVTEVLAA